MKTVKAYTIKEVSARELFDSKSRSLTSAEIDALKRKILDCENKVHFFTREGITFYVSYTNDITILSGITDMIKKTRKSSWKFGFVNRITGKIVLLFGGHVVADENSVKDVFKITSEVVKLRFNDPELIPFSIKNKIKNEKTNDHRG
jgi:ethanolamine utilization microcompartment shell protein EutS